MWPTLMEIPRTVDVVYDNQLREWERDGDDWVTYGSFIQRWSTAVTDLSGWGPFIDHPTSIAELNKETTK